mgnify:CR=1 FL=1
MSKKINIYTTVLGKTKLKYWRYGSRPQLLIHSGTHGDEFEVIHSVEKALRKYLPLMPDFIFVPHVSPSAVATHTRVNHLGADLNRSFFDDASDPEVLLNQRLALKYPTVVNISFHEDPQNSAFYLYEGGAFSLLESTNFIQRLRTSLTAANIPLFDGIDDPNDPVLGEKINHGYFYYLPDPHSKNDGTWAGWGLSHHLFKRFLIPEIPGKLPQFQKDLIVDLIFQNVLLPLYF